MIRPRAHIKLSLHIPENINKKYSGLLDHDSDLDTIAKGDIQIEGLRTTRMEIKTQLDST